MDGNRQIRFVIPPFFLLASLLWGAHFGDVDLNPYLQSANLSNFAAQILATAAVLLSVGFVISAITARLLWTIAQICGVETYEAVFDEVTLTEMLARTHSTANWNRQLTLYTAVTFDHELLNKGIHEWLMRRWNYFNTAANSIVALILAHVVGMIISIDCSCQWIGMTVVIIGFLGWAGIDAWRQTMHMMKFQSTRPVQLGPVAEDFRL